MTAWARGAQVGGKRVASNELETKGRRYGGAENGRAGQDGEQRLNAGWARGTRRGPRTVPPVPRLLDEAAAQAGGSGGRRIVIASGLETTADRARPRLPQGALGAGRGRNKPGPGP